MRKIEQAALNHAPYMLTVDEQARNAFVAGARYVLNAMVSDAAIRAANESVARDDEGEFRPLGDLIWFSGEDRIRTVLRAALAAVRKEIEG